MKPESQYGDEARLAVGRGLDGVAVLRVGVAARGRAGRAAEVGATPQLETAAGSGRVRDVDQPEVAAARRGRGVRWANRRLRTRRSGRSRRRRCAAGRGGAGPRARAARVRSSRCSAAPARRSRGIGHVQDLQAAEEARVGAVAAAHLDPRDRDVVPGARRRSGRCRRRRPRPRSRAGCAARETTRGTDGLRASITATPLAIEGQKRCSPPVFSPRSPTSRRRRTARAPRRRR